MGTLILQNIENIRLPKNNEEIYLFQQFFIHPEEEHREEIRDCLRRNIGLGIFKKIYLLNERIYTKEELGVDHIKDPHCFHSYTIIIITIIMGLCFIVANNSQQ